MLNDPFDHIDDFAIDDSVSAIDRILLIGRRRLGIRLRNVLSQENGYDLYCTPKIDDAINYMFQITFPIILLDMEDPDLDIISISNSLRQVQSIVRIILVTQTSDIIGIKDIINKGNINAILQISISDKEFLKIILEQEARYTIDYTMTSFVSKPPTLSKASYLLLDPTLSFGDETQPLNFVGILINSDTVSKFAHFFEKTIVQDELLLASYLASINALGEELFSKHKTVKEINFGGISVIFRFHKSLQFSFLVRNLSRHNCDKAEERIDSLIDMILSNYGEDLMENYLTEDTENDLLLLLDDFDQFDEVEEFLHIEVEKYRAETFRVNQIVASYTNNLKLNESTIQTLEQIKSKDLDYHTVIPENDEDLLWNLRGSNSGVLILDSKSENVLSLARYAKDTSPAISIICVHNSQLLSTTLTDGLNNDLFDYFLVQKENEYYSDELLKLCLRGLKNSRKIIERALKEQKSDDQIINPVVAKSKLRLDANSFNVEELPRLNGILISHKNQPIFEKFWHSDTDKRIDKDLLTGLISSLNQVGGEIFTDKESIGSLDIGDYDVFVKHRDDYIFLYFIKNVQANTGVLLSMELDGVSAIYNELLIEAGTGIPVNLLKPIFDKIAEKTHADLTQLLEKHVREDDS
ncbi:MAG: hypothetical protein GPJ54_00885 [Candidatus Heimdallarchaeota archaeon]|nr:hypothetical protein [Candidatus Heimdallarchaeota archaeon]